MQPYIVEDQYADPGLPADVWATFLAARFSKREELYESLSSHEKKIVKKELRRIRYLRGAHGAWRDGVSLKCKEELHRCEVGIARSSGYRRQELNRERLILKQIQQWSTQQYARLQRSISPESYIIGLDAADDTLDDNPTESNYGYNGWVITFRKGEGGVTLNHPLCHGRFRHQKISMQRLLYDPSQTPLKRSAERSQLRYFHLQANNMLAACHPGVHDRKAEGVGGHMQRRKRKF
ncbi:hypothetical protein C8A00DRAFT_37398 [Chaetomidium leptoderma]|uniref:Uncharacterized protein n=1 Tax=Chaetomidium leptoderma TaxID=669021 RepID=A0AAN6VEM2_9PEZI|nr:hypothetical protein C8A00DRAFT_37398 [Chaetomidium leptoderma]